MAATSAVRMAEWRKNTGPVSRGYKVRRLQLLEVQGEREKARDDDAVDNGYEEQCKINCTVSMEHFYSWLLFVIMILLFWCSHFKFFVI